eukprot:53470-Prorocentrum_minimum.AAC.2
MAEYSPVERAQVRLQGISMHLTAADGSDAYRGSLLRCREELRKFIDEVNCAPILIRCAWHDAGTYNRLGGAWPNCGGANGSIRFEVELEHGANAGLPKAINYLKGFKKVCASLFLPYSPQRPINSFHAFWNHAFNLVFDSRAFYIASLSELLCGNRHIRKSPGLTLFSLPVLQQWRLRAGMYMTALRKTRKPRRSFVKLIYNDTSPNSDLPCGWLQPYHSDALRASRHTDP